MHQQGSALLRDWVRSQSLGKVLVGVHWESWAFFSKSSLMNLIVYFKKVLLASNDKQIGPELDGKGLNSSFEYNST